MKKYFYIFLSIIFCATITAQNVGINTTGAAPAATNLLEVLSASTTASSVGIYSAHSGAISGTGYGIWIQKTGASTTNVAGYFSASGATNNYAIIVPAAGGRVGIGTSDPESLLEVQGPEATDATITLDADDGDDDADAWHIKSTATGNYLNFTNHTTEYYRMEINASGVPRLEVLNNGRTIAIGDQAGASDDGSNNANIFIGANTGDGITSGGDNIALGYQALTAAGATTNNQVVIGTGARKAATGGYRNVDIGGSVSTNATGGTYNVNIGYGAAGATDGGSNNVVIGGLAGQGVGGTAYDNNVIIGYGAADALANNGNSNVIIGQGAGSLVSTGDYNILLGYDAGNNLTTGSDNIVIGRRLDVPNATGSDQLTIGNLIFGTNLDSIGTGLSSGKIGIGVVAPSSKFHVHSIAANTVAIQTLENTAGNYQSFVTTASPNTAITGSIGDMANDVTNGIFYYKTSGTATNTGWTALNSTTSSNWNITGNASTTAGTNFIGTTDAIDFVVKTSGTERGRFSSAGVVVLGDNTQDGHQIGKLIVDYHGSGNPAISGAGGSGSKIHITNSTDISFEGGAGILASASKASPLYFRHNRTNYGFNFSTVDADTVLEIEANGNIAFGTHIAHRAFEISKDTAVMMITREDATTVTDEILGSITFESSDGGPSTQIEYDGSAAIKAFASENHSSSTKGAYLTFTTKANGTGLNANGTEHMRLTQDGKFGIGTITPQSKLEVAGSFALPLSTKTAAYTATASDHTLLGDATAAGFTITLPTAVGITGRMYVIKKIDASVNTVTVDGNGAQTIDGAATNVISAQYDRIVIQSDGANWVRID